MSDPALEKEVDQIYEHETGCTVTIVATRSPEINELATALAKAQGAIEGAQKDSENPFFSSKYADLASVWNAIRKPLAENGLSIIQRPYGLTGIETILLHSSGQWISGGKMEIAPARKWKEAKDGAEKKMVQMPPDAHGIGSAITYARRYTLMAVAGVAPEDDDGNAATGKSSETKKVEVKKPEGNGIGKAKNAVLKSIKNLPEEQQKEWNAKVAKAKTIEAVKKIEEEVGGELF